MTPEKALALVQGYSEYKKKLDLLTKKIGESINKCPGRTGARVNDESDVDSKGRDKTTHLWGWYQPKVMSNGWNNQLIQYHDISEIEHGVECPHCYAAHAAIQERKIARKKFGTIKAQMSRVKVTKG